MDESSIRFNRINTKDEVLDVRLLDQLKVGRQYSIQELRETFNISSETPETKLLALLDEKILLEPVNNTDNLYKYLGRHSEHDRKIVKVDLSKHKHKKLSVSEINKELTKLRVGQVYSEQNLAEIFNVPIDEDFFQATTGLMEWGFTGNGNYRLVHLNEPTGELITTEAPGYNPLVKNVYQSLRNKYGDKPFVLYMADIPVPIRKKMAPGVLPTIIKYLLELGVLEKVESKQTDNKYKIISDLELDDPNS